MDTIFLIKLIRERKINESDLFIGIQIYIYLFILLYHEKILNNENILYARTINHWTFCQILHEMWW